MKKNKIKAGLIFLLFIMGSTHSLFCQVDPLAYPVRLWNEYKTAGKDSIKIERLFDLAFFYSDYMGDDNLADSASRIAIRIAEMSHRPSLLLNAYNRYIESNNLDRNNQRALGYALKAEQITSARNNPDMDFRTYKNLVSVYLSGYNYDKALEYGYKSLSIASTNENNSWKAESYLEIGKSLEGKNQVIEAFRNYLNAVSLAERIKNKALLIRCYDQLSGFYNFNKLYYQSTHYKLLQGDLLRTQTPVDSVALMWTIYDLQVIDITSNNNQLNEGSMQEILDFAKRNRHNRMLHYGIALYRTHLIEADRIGRLQELYNKQFPHELERLATDNPALYTRLKAFFCEEEKKADSALYYFSKAEILLQSDPNKILLSNFYHRFGQFFMRQGENNKAIAKFIKSYELAKSVSYFDYMLSASVHLESLYAGKPDYKNAYAYAVLNRVLTDSISNMSKKDQFLIMELDHETREREHTAEVEKESTTRRHYLQYSAMLIGIIGVFIVLLMLGSLSVPEWIIKMLGFFSFIFLFEFIILIADHKIHDITAGEPWKILLIKIFLIAILLPMHHWIEKRVISYLIASKVIDFSKVSVKKMIREQVTRIKRK
jgi:hypothetical protein